MQLLLYDVGGRDLNMTNSDINEVMNKQTCLTSPEVDDPEKTISAYLQRKSQRERAENVQVLVATGIIGWYLSANNSQLINISFTSDGFFFAFTTLSALFLYVKLNILAFKRTFDWKWIDEFDDSVVQFLYIYGFNGVVATAVLDLTLPILGLQVMDQNILIIVLSGLCLISAVYTYGSYNRSQKIREQNQKISEYLTEYNKKDVLDLVIENPELIEENFSVTTTETVIRVNGWRTNIDIIGEDSNNNQVAIFVFKNINEDIIRNTINRIEDIKHSDSIEPLSKNFDRFIVVADILEVDTKPFDEKNIELLSIQNIIDR